MHLTKMKRAWAVAAAIALGAAGIAPLVTAQERPAPSAPLATVDKNGSVIVSIGSQSRFQMKSKKPIKEAFNENDKVVQVLADANDPTTLILIGRTPGTSKVDLTDAAGAKESYLFVVDSEDEALRKRAIDELRDLIRKTVPTASVEITPILRPARRATTAAQAGAPAPDADRGLGLIVLSGYAAQEADRATITALAEALGLRVAVNHVTVGGGGNVPHVQLDVTLAKVDRSRARSRGASFIFNGNTTSGGSLLGGLTSSQAGGGGGGGAAGGTGGTVGLIPAAATVAATSGANLIFGIVPSNFQALLAVLKTEGLAKLVAAPTIVARSGEEGMISVGGDVPVISASSGITGPGVTTHKVGTDLRCTPIVYGNGKIFLDVTIEVNSVNQALALTTSFGVTPGFDRQTMHTSIIAEPGQTIALGGLIQTSTQATISKIPCLGDIPYLGSAFSFATQTDSETEMVVILTPRLIDPADASQMPKPLPGSETRKPDDFEFYLETMLEAPRGQRTFDAHNYVPAWKTSNLAGTYPCVGGNCGTPAAAGGQCATGNCPAPAPVATGAAPVPANPAPLPVLKPMSLPPLTDLTSPADVPPPVVPTAGRVTVSEPADVPGLIPVK